MKKTLIILAIAAAASSAPAVFSPGIASASVSDWQKGVSLYPQNPGDFSSSAFDQSLSNAHAAGADTAVLIIPLYQTDDNSSSIFTGYNTPSDADIVSAGNYAKSIGMKVVLKPHVDPLNGDWRANINPSNRDQWYGSYGYWLNHIGDLGTQVGAAGIVVGTELISTADYTVNPDNTERWQKLISDLRQHFSGFLTYSANWGSGSYAEEPPHIGFWPSLDYIGISAYYPLASGVSNPSVNDLTGSWSYWDTAKLQSLHTQYGKNIIFTEIGYRSVDNAHNLPWYSNPGGNYNPTEQVNDYTALFQYWNNQPYMSGIYAWNWGTNPNDGGSGNTDYTPQNKPAQATLTSWFGGSGSASNPPPNNPPPNNPPPGPGPSSASGNWTVSGQAPSLSAGQSASISADVGISGSASNATVDMEIYDSSGHQVMQQFFSGKDIGPTPSQFTISWTPPANDAYELKVGIFSSDWSKLYYWDDSALALDVGGASSGGGAGSTGGSPSGPAILDVWWPSDGSTISGVQPFKAIIEDQPLSAYTMYWQVDGGALNQMSDSQTDYPHKEADVDVGPWSWRGANGSGPYTVTFVAKDQNGNVIAQKTASISVAHW
ncbi:hypothetical protein KGP36_00915 [Patescibacteria group bacterium]|nr:hypothetical protein [Patescibacteria group bacterium]MDE1940997.1 hypothetical protein [Patescibacteria group bacterium]